MVYSDVTARAACSIQSSEIWYHCRQAIFVLVLFDAILVLLKNCSLFYHIFECFCAGGYFETSSPLRVCSGRMKFCFGIFIYERLTEIYVYFCRSKSTWNGCTLYVNDWDAIFFRSSWMHSKCNVYCHVFAGLTSYWSRSRDASTNSISRTYFSALSIGSQPKSVFSTFNRDWFRSNSKYARSSKVASGHHTEIRKQLWTEWNASASTEHFSSQTIRHSQHVDRKTVYSDTSISLSSLHYWSKWNKSLFICWCVLTDIDVTDDDVPNNSGDPILHDWSWKWVCY